MQWAVPYRGRRSIYSGKPRQSADRATALDLLKAVNRFAQIFWEIKGIQTKMVKAPYKPEEEVVYPIL